jgi:2-polyprenyl-6-methoxyphenol hydroxylase-like FAD-dependent oxidoreductase
MQNLLQKSYDVLVVGGGPVGLASAIALRRKGLDVVLAERRNLPVINACGEGLLPNGIACLERLGVFLPQDETYPLSGISFHDAGQTLLGTFSGAAGIGITRARLHHELRRRAEKMGVELLWGEPVRRIEAGRALLAGGNLSAGWIVAADGNNSPTRRRLGLNGRPRYTRVGLRRHYQKRPWSDRVQVWFGAGCQLYVTPTSPDRVSVVLLTENPSLGFDHHMRSFPELEQHLVGCRQLSRERGAITSFQRARRVTHDRIALVGDAGMSLDAIAGEGLALGFLQAEAVAEAIAVGDLQAYARAHARIVRLPALMTRLLLMAHRSTRLRRGLAITLGKAPALLDALMAMHTRSMLPATSRQVTS